MHEGTGKDTFPCAMTQIDKGATRVIKGIVPTVWIPVLVFFLDPSEDFAE